MTSRVILFLAFFAFIFANTKDASAKEITPYDDYKTELISYFSKKNIDIKPYLDDNRFSLYERITNKFTNSAENKTPSLEQYKKAIGFADKARDMSGFIEKYNSDLSKAEQEYGISKNVIVAILGIESHYGKYSGTYNPFKAYVSMYAEGHRVKFALEQIEHLLLFAQKNDLDVYEMKSSYAGAMSYAQFIPTSLNRWFVGKELYNMSNNIYSVANYLAHFKKITGDIEGAVHRYNPSQLYVGAVMALSEEAAKVYANR